jgi:hypothetical protein
MKVIRNREKRTRRKGEKKGYRNKRERERERKYKEA